MGQGSWRALGALVVGLVFSGVVSAASITAPTTSTTGTFTVSWTPGYELWLADSDWRFAGPPTTSMNFNSLPSGVYKFMLVSCSWVYDEEGPWGYHLVCSRSPATAKTVTVTRDAEPTIATSSEAGSTAYTANVTGRGSAQLNVPIPAPAAEVRSGPASHCATTVHARATGSPTRSTTCWVTAGS